MLNSQLQDKNADISIDRYPFLIGRNESCFEKIHIHFPHITDLISFLSKQHASFDLDDHQLTIVDLGSINGTKINGHPIGNQKVYLHHGDRISFAEQLHYTLIDTDYSDEETVPHLVLEPVSKQLGLTAISINQSSFTIGRNIQVFANVLEQLQDEMQNVSRQHCKIQWEDEQFYLKDLGSTNGTYVNERLLGKDESVTLQNGMTVSLSPMLSYHVKITPSKNKLHEDKDKTRILSDAKNELAESVAEPEKEVGEHTIYMKDATSFLSFLSDEHHEKIDQEKIVRKESPQWKFTKPASWITSFTTKRISILGTVIIIIAIIIYSFNQSSIRQLNNLFDSGEFKQAAIQAQEILAKNPGHHEAQELLFHAVTRGYLIDWADKVHSGQPDQAMVFLNEARYFAENNEDISSLLQSLRLVTDLAENIPVSSLDQLAIDINLAARYKNIYQEWNRKKLDNRAFLERLLQVDSLFAELQEAVYRKLNLLEILVSQHLEGVDGLQKDIVLYLISGQPEKIGPLLDNFSEKYTTLKGVESFRSDLSAYLEIISLIQRHDSIALFKKTSSYRPATSPFREHLPNLLLLIPSREELQAFAKAETSWQQGDADQAISILKQTATGIWSEYAQSRLVYFQKIHTHYLQLRDAPTSPSYPAKLIELREMLEERDIFFREYTEKRLNDTNALQ